MRTVNMYKPASNYEIPKLPRLTEEELLKIASLSFHQYRIFCLYGIGKSTREISQTPGTVCSIKTVETHYAHIKEKLDLKDKTRLVHLATRFLLFAELQGITATEFTRTQATPNRRFIIPSMKVANNVAQQAEI